MCLFYVYMVRCSDDSLYTGYTTDVNARIAAHNTGRGAKYTRGRQPVELVYVEEFEEKSPALQREYQIKQLRKQAKEGLTRRFDGSALVDREKGQE